MPSRAAQRAYYERNRDLVIARSAVQRAADPEAELAYQRAYYERNQEEVRERARQWYHDDPERAQDKVLEWQRKNPERRKQHKAKSTLKASHGLAHRTCNTAIGMLFDDPNVLRQVADNLEAAQLLLSRRAAF